MTVPYEAYNEGAKALAQKLGLSPGSFCLGSFHAGTLDDFITANNPYPAEENWALFEPSDDLDYDALEGRKAKLVHEDGGELTFTMRRDPGTLSADTYYAWDAPLHAWMLFLAGWRGNDGWKLYIQGDLPAKRVTADTLEPGTGFDGVAPNGRSYHSLIRIISAQGKSLVLSTSSIEYFKAKEVEVTEVYGIGTFQKPTKENQ